jgi:enoyl-CoA hydratase/carnithine racemase
MVTDLVVSYECRESVAQITMNCPPVNALGLAVRQGLVTALHRAAQDGEARAVVLAGSGRCFSAGGDIREFGTPAVFSAPRLTLDVQPAIERMPKPVVAAIHGFALGGGLETAMACHFRAAAADALIALPEVTLGVIPISGTQRLPRLIPLERAIDLILTGAKRRAADFADTSLFDVIVAGQGGGTEGHAALHEAARSFALAAAAQGPPYPRASSRAVATVQSQEVLAAASAQLDREAASGAQRQALAAIAAAVNSADFAAGLREANAICEILLASDQVRASATRFLGKET